MNKHLVPVNNFKHIAFFFTLFKGYKCNKLYEITPKKRFSLEPEKTNFKTFKFSHNEILLMTILDHFTRVFSIPVKFEIFWGGAPVRNCLWCYYR